jgi:SSS family solute:Na+ symporter
MYHVSPDMINSVLPDGWKNIFFGWNVDLNWTSVTSAAATKVHAFSDWIKTDGYTMFGLFFGMLLFKGIFVAAAGPAPNYDMQRILSTRNPKEASKMSSLVNVVLNPTRYFMIAGLTVLALANFDTLYKSSITSPDFETILPEVMAKYIPVGLLGFLMAGLLAAFMSNFAATVNAAPAYIVNDIYKRFINPNAHPKKYVRMSYITSIAVVIVGIAVGFAIESINNVVLWITGALWGGYTASNVLKWYWWRFNGYGYFWGMVSGIAAAVLVPVLNQLHMIDFLVNWPLSSNLGMNAFPFIFILSILGCFLGTLLTPAENDEILIKFYKTVKPWGFWKPIREKVLLANPNFVPNRNFKRDMFNILVGMVWQITLMAAPVFLVLREYSSLIISVVIMIVTSAILKYTWWDKLSEMDEEVAAEIKPVLEQEPA